MAEVPAPIIEQPVAVVTGASSGFGESIYRALAEQGYMTIGIARREDRLAALTEEAGGAYVVCDVTDQEQVDAAASSILAEYGYVDFLVNNAGMPMREHFISAHPEKVAKVMNTNYMGGLLLTRALTPGLQRAAEEGAFADVVDMVSAAATITNPNSGPYSASKAAQLAESRCLRSDLRPLGITVHSVLPGKADTEGHPQPRKTSPVSRLMSGITGTDVEAVTGTVLRRRGRRPAEIYVPRVLKTVGLVYDLAPATTGRVVSSVLS